MAGSKSSSSSVKPCKERIPAKRAAASSGSILIEGTRFCGNSSDFDFCLLEFGELDRVFFLPLLSCFDEEPAEDDDDGN